MPEFFDQRNPRNLGEFAQFLNGKMPAKANPKLRPTLPTARPSSIASPLSPPAAAVQPVTHDVNATISPGHQNSPLITQHGFQADPNPGPSPPASAYAPRQPESAATPAGGSSFGGLSPVQRDRIRSANHTHGPEIAQKLMERQLSDNARRDAYLAKPSPFLPGGSQAEHAYAAPSDPGNVQGGRVGRIGTPPPVPSSGALTNDIAARRNGSVREGQLFDISHPGMDRTPAIGVSPAPTNPASYGMQMDAQNPGGRQFGGLLPARISDSGGANRRVGFLAPPNAKAPEMSQGDKAQFSKDTGNAFNPETGLMGNPSATGGPYRAFQQMAITGRGPLSPHPSPSQLQENREKYLAQRATDAKTKSTAGTPFQQRYARKQQAVQNQLAALDPAAFQGRMAVEAQQRGAGDRLGRQLTSNEAVAAGRDKATVAAAQARGGLEPPNAAAPDRQIAALQGHDLKPDDHHELLGIAGNGSRSEVINWLHSHGIREERTVNRVLGELGVVNKTKPHSPYMMNPKDVPFAPPNARPPSPNPGPPVYNYGM